MTLLKILKYWYGLKFWSCRKMLHNLRTQLIHRVFFKRMPKFQWVKILIKTGFLSINNSYVTLSCFQKRASVFLRMKINKEHFLWWSPLNAISHTVNTQTKVKWHQSYQCHLSIWYGTFRSTWKKTLC